MNFLMLHDFTTGVEPAESPINHYHQVIGMGHGQIVGGVTTTTSREHTAYDDRLGEQAVVLIRDVDVLTYHVYLRVGVPL